MRIPSFLLVVLFVLASGAGYGQGTAPTFRYNTGSGSVALPGRDPAQGGTTVIPTVLVPVRLLFNAGAGPSKPLAMDSAGDVPRVLRSPVFAKVPFAAEGETQYADALLRAMAGTAADWHTLLGKPEVKPVTVEIPAGYGYVLTSKRTGTRLGMVDAEYVQREIFRQLPRQDGKLVIALTRNTAYYAYGDATVCCTWGTHGVDEATGNSFVLASYLGTAPPLVEERDVQPLTEQLAEWVKNPLHDPLFHIAFRHPAPAEENVVPAWQWPASEGSEHHGCGGSNPATRYTLQDPLDTNQRSDLPAGPARVMHARGEAWHVANVALMGWYTGGAGPYSFPDAQMLRAPATPCPAVGARPAGQALVNEPAPPPEVAAVLPPPANNGHELIGYWTGNGPGGTLLRLRDVSPQWDVIIVAFANVNHQAPEGTLQMHVRRGMDLAQMKDDIGWLKSQGKKVLISLGGGGEYFSLAQTASIPNFVNSVTQIVEQYGFDGIDLDFESPSLVLDQGDTDFRHPKTASVVNLIAGLRQLRQHFGSDFMLSLVPEGTQIPAGYPGYGGQFGTYLPLLWGVRDIVSFVDVQDYNTPPLQGLDGEIYQMGSVNYDAAMTELLLHGFPVGGRGGDFFPPLPADKVAVGFLVGATTPKLVNGAMQYLITGKAPEGVTYRLRTAGGYPELIGAMFWTIDADRDQKYGFSNLVGPQLHGYPSRMRRVACNISDRCEAQSVPSQPLLTIDMAHYGYHPLEGNEVELVFGDIGTHLVMFSKDMVIVYQTQPNGPRRGDGSAKMSAFTINVNTGALIRRQEWETRPRHSAIEAKDSEARIVALSDDRYVAMANATLYFYDAAGSQLSRRSLGEGMWSMQPTGGGKELLLRHEKTIGGISQDVEYSWIDTTTMEQRASFRDRDPGRSQTGMLGVDKTFVYPSNDGLHMQSTDDRNRIICDNPFCRERVLSAATATSGGVAIASRFGVGVVFPG